MYNRNMARLEIFLLGSFQVTLDSEPLTNFESDKARALLAYLAVEADRPHRREVLAGLLWPDTPEQTARTNLRSALANLRQVLRDHQAQPPYLLVTRQTIQLNPEGDYWLDVNAFHEAADKRGDQGEDPAPVSTTELNAVVDLYRGQFLAGFYLRDAPLFDDWALITRESLQRSVLNAMHFLTEHYQETGDHELALQLARRQVELEPYQEAAHQQVMWTLALNGQRNEALLHYEGFKDLLETELGVAPLEQTQEMYARLVEGELPGSPATDLILRREPRTVGACPYRGLAAFREADAPFFYGREEFTNRLIENVYRHSAMTVMVGSSGSGKSSAVFAGLLPQLQEAGDWLLVDSRPGERPFQGMAAALLSHLEPGTREAEGNLKNQELSAALQEGERSLPEVLQEALSQHPTASRLLLVIDQFEELYTLCPDRALRSRFLDVLLSATASGKARHRVPFRLVLTLRADFMGQALSYRPFADALDESALVLGPMNQDELRAAIATPAEGQGAAFEPGLVTRVLEEVGQEPGNLPLLEFALTLLWERLDQGWLTHAAYEEIGRVGGALARYAEDAYLALDEDQQEDAQRVFVQLVQPGQGTEDTRRIGSKSDLEETRWKLIQHLADKRLVVTDQDDEGRETVEIIHETLIREWDRLRKWVDADRAFRVWQEQVRVVIHQWEDSGRDKAALLRGVSLSKAENWLIERSNDLSSSEREFIQTSLHARRERQEAEAIRQERERSLERRSRTFLQVLAIVLLLATSVSIGFALVARNEARQATEAASLSLAANARQALNDQDATTALVLAMAANRIEDSPRESQRILLEAAFAPGPKRSFEVTEMFEGVEGPPLSVAITPDSLAGTGGRTALTGFFDGTIVLWELDTGKEIRRFSGHAPGTYDPLLVVTHSGVNDIVLSPSGQIAVSGGDDGAVIVWDINTGEETLRFEGHSGPVRAVAISPDGLTVISGGLSGSSMMEPGELVLWDLRTGQEIRRFEGQAEAIVDIAISPDGNRLVASSGEVAYSSAVLNQTYSLFLWDVKSGELVHSFENIDRDVPSLAVNPNGKFVLSASTDHNLYLWDVESGEQLQAFEGHADLVRTVAFNATGSRAISGGGDGEVVLWNVEEGELLARFNAHTAGVTDISFSPDTPAGTGGRIALSAASDDTIILWDLFNATEINRFEGHEAAVLDVAFTPNGDYIVSASGSYDPAVPIIEEDSLRLWNLESGEITGSLDWHFSDMFQMDISPDGRRVLSGHMMDASLRLWNFATGQEIRKLEGHVTPIFSAAISPDGRHGLSGGMDSQIILWDLEKGAEIRRFLGSQGVIWALAISPDGRTALSGADDRSVIWWDLETGEEIQRLAGHEELTITAVAFSPDGKQALSGDARGLVIEWNLETGEEIQRFAAHKGTSNVGRTRVAYLPDGLKALSSGWDGTLALWDLQTGEEIHRFRGHGSDFIFDIAISPDGHTALSCATDRTIIQWQLDIPSLEELQEWIATNRYVRDLTCDERELYQIEPLCTP